MNDQVQDFLRRVAEMRAQAAAQAKGQSAPPPTSPQPKPPKQKPSARLVPAPAPATAPVAAEIVEAELMESGDRVSRRVAEDLRGSERIAEHTRHLADDVKTADDKLEAHLHQVFDHQVGRLKHVEREAASPTDKNESALSQIQRLLRSPSSLRDAIIMAEILRRPEL